MTITKNAMNFGAILGLSLCALSGVFLALGMSQSGVQQWIMYALIICFIYIGTKSFRDKQSDGFISFGNALSSGVLISFFSAVILAFFLFLYLTLVDASMIEKSMEIAEQKMITDGMPDDQIEMGMKYARMFTTPLMISIITVMWNTFMGLIFALLTSAFLKKENTDFNQFIENNN